MSLQPVAFPSGWWYYNRDEAFLSKESAEIHAKSLAKSGEAKKTRVIKDTDTGRYFVYFTKT